MISLDSHGMETIACIPILSHVYHSFPGHIQQSCLMGFYFFLIGLKSYPILARPSRSQWEHFEVSRMWPWDSKGVAD
jgi:hypothetical protein